MQALPPVVCFLPYALVSLLHLYACAAGRQPVRRATKVLLMPLLALAYVLTGAASGPAVLFALLLGLAGDALLIRPDIKPRQLGGAAAFLAGHCVYLALLLQKVRACPALPLPWLPPAAFLALALPVFIALRPITPREMQLPGTCYVLVLAALGALSGMALLGAAPRGWALLLGASLFFASDTILSRQFFTVGDPAPKYDFAVMLTYLLAQLFLVLGFSA